MNEVKAGRILRLVRRRRRLTQTQLAALAGISQQTVSSIELGHADDTALRTIRRLAAPLGITVELDLKWRGPEFDRLDDARHAAIVRAVVARFGPEWEIVVEYTFNHFGDRGSVDVLAWHAARSALLLIEIKSELDSLEAVLRSMDVKVRVVPPLVAAQQGWRLSALGSVLVLPDESSSRRAVAEMGVVFNAALPRRTVDVRKWLAEPAGALRGIWFLATTPARGAIRNPGSPGLVRKPRDPRLHAQATSRGRELPAVQERVAARPRHAPMPDVPDENRPRLAPGTPTASR